MDAIHLHLMLVHLPIVLVPVGLLLLLAGALRHSRELQAAALALHLVAGATCWVAKESGERAEESIERMHLPAIGSESLQHQHEEMAEKATALCLLLGLFSLAGLVRPPSRPLLASHLVLAAVATGMLAYTGFLGGQIRHSEIRGGSDGIPPQTQDSGHHDD